MERVALVDKGLEGGEDLLARGEGGWAREAVEGNEGKEVP